MRVLRLVTVVAMSVGFVLSGSLVRGDDAQPKGKEQIWEGKLKVRPGFEIRLVVRATVNDGAGLVATLDSPDEGLSGLKLSSVVIDASRLAFELKVTDAKFEGKMNEAKTEAKGTWTQRGAVSASDLREEGQSDACCRRPSAKSSSGKASSAWGRGFSFAWCFTFRKPRRAACSASSTARTRGQRGCTSIRSHSTKQNSRFELKSIGATFEGKLSADKNEAVGTFTQGGAKLPLTLKKTDKLTAATQAADAEAAVPLQGRGTHV